MEQTIPLTSEYPMDEPFKQGYQDFVTGESTLNYKEGTPEYKEYQRGYDSAYFKNRDRFEESGIRGILRPTTEGNSGRRNYRKGKGLFGSRFSSKAS